VRDPLFVNRLFTFLKPGHYGVTVTTPPLKATETVSQLPAEDACERCLETNSVGIEIAEQEERKESALVADLARDLEETKPRSSRLPNAGQ
jgi:hypothetical protein